MPLKQYGGMVMQDPQGLTGNLLPYHKAAVDFTPCWWSSCCEQAEFKLLCDGGASERHICSLWLLKSQPPGSMGGALLCWGAAAAAQWVTPVLLCAIRHSESAELPVSQAPVNEWMNEWMRERRPCRIWIQKGEGAIIVEMRETESLTRRYWSDRSELVDA